MVPLRKGLVLAYKFFFDAPVLKDLLKLQLNYISPAVDLF